ncbi:hypothetical protein M2387_001041 [Klebsiella sp. BIGb0407]|nr:hypothetical protein [Klebsiella sp. BIGb0407]
MTNVSEQFISMQLITLPLVINVVTLILRSPHTTKFMLEHSFSNMRRDTFFRKSSNQRSPEIMCSPVSNINTIYYEPNKPLSGSDADRLIDIFIREKDFLINHHRLFKQRIYLLKDRAYDDTTHFAMLFMTRPSHSDQIHHAPKASILKP